MNKLHEIEIDLTIAKPPLPAFLGERLSHILGEIVQTSDIRHLFTDHRYGGTSRDIDSAVLWLSPRFESALSSDRIIITNGTKSAIHAILSFLVSPGGRVATEDFSPLKVWSLLDILGLRHVPIECDAHGILPDALERRCLQETIGALFIVPTLNNPNTYTTPYSRRLDIAEVARKNGVAIIEDDICGRLKSNAPPAFASLAPDITWLVSGLAKCLGSGVRVGHIVGPDAGLVSKLTQRLRPLSGWHPAPIMAEIATRWISDGTAEEVLAEIRKDLRIRQALSGRILGDFGIQSDPEGLFFWLPLPRCGSTDGIVQELRKDGVIVRSTDLYASYTANDIRIRALRICIGSTELSSLEESLWLLQRAVQATVQNARARPAIDKSIVM
ncbi:PLP-dependent aminotransferase family protein [Mesorhizobium sp. M0293]|uniref:aminotransferase-like domain-containing protein n=1 Tax=Mesorhizobium sp. M0293 TaxID=2956930 RepID=UPI00333DB79D